MITSSVQKSDQDAFLIRLIAKDFQVDPEEIGRALSLHPEVSWKRGDPKLTPTGRTLEGLRSSSLWSYSSDGMPEARFDVFLLSLVERIKNAQSTFEVLRDSGARVELMLCLFGGKNVSGVIPADVLGILSELNIYIGIEVYPRT